MYLTCFEGIIKCFVYSLSVSVFSRIYGKMTNKDDFISDRSMGVAAII